MKTGKLKKLLSITGYWKNLFALKENLISAHDSLNKDNHTWSFVHVSSIPLIVIFFAVVYLKMPRSRASYQREIDNRIWFSGRQSKCSVFLILPDRATLDFICVIPDECIIADFEAIAFNTSNCILFNTFLNMISIEVDYNWSWNSDKRLHLPMQFHQFMKNCT